MARNPFHACRSLAPHLTASDGCGQPQTGALKQGYGTKYDTRETIDLSPDEVKKLEHPENFPCEARGHEVIAQRSCRSYRFVGLEEEPMNICYDPTLATILEMDSDVWMRLDKIEEKPQPESLFNPPPDHIVVVKYENWGETAPK